MSKTDEETIRDAITYFIHTSDTRQRALAALDSLMSRSMPELPEGWFIRVQDTFYTEPERKWYAMLENYGTGMTIASHGPTIRASCEAAIKKIEEQKQ
ncbi:MAG: hypothetical protein WAL34_04205 [Acidobacteriaceae bacterium]